MTSPKQPGMYKRVLLKISGESLAESQGDIKSGILCQNTLRRLASEIASLVSQGIQICIVVGGGNIIRGSKLTKELDIDRSTADTMGMLATVINALAMQQVIEASGIPCRVLTGLQMTSVAEPFVQRKALRHLEKGRVVIFASGTGNPYFTTDTAAALRALEMNCDALLKATNVDGVYDKDPQKHKDATFISETTYTEALNQNLQVMDAAAFGLLRDYKIPLIVFSIHKDNALIDVVHSRGIFTIIKPT